MPKAKAKRSSDTELLQQAQARAAGEKLFHNLLDAAPDAVFEVNSQGLIIRANAAVEDLFGYTPAELSNQPVERLITQEIRKTHIQHRKAYDAHPVRRPMGSAMDLFALRKDGSRFPVDIVLSPFETEEGGRHTAAVVRDITVRKQAESELKEARQLAETANRAKSDFLASMSHELRSPLNTIMGYTQLLAEQAVGELNEKQRRFLGHIAKDSQHLLDLINDILDLSKIEAGRLEVQRQSAALQPLLDDVLAMLRPRAVAKGVQLENLIPDGAIYLGDPLRVKQVIVNLLSNAIKFTPTAGSVTLSAVQMDRQIAITVADTGVGIAPEHQQAIFERFRQVPSGLHSVNEGTGLGLAITKALVEQMGGRITVQSDAGKGSHFTFTLDGNLSSVHNGTRVLVVDDEPMAAQLVEEYLNPEGYDVTICSSVESAVGAIDSQLPDVVILDLMMPGRILGGLDLLKRLKGAARTQGIPVIVVSVLERSASATTGSGAAAHLTKPVHKQRLLEAIREVEKSSGKLPS